MNIVDSIEAGIISRGGSDSIAIEHNEQGISYGTLIDSSEYWTDRLCRQGVGRHARVALLCPDGIDYLIVCLAVLRVSAVLIPIHAATSREEILQICNRLGVEFLLFDPALFCHKDSTIMLLPAPEGTRFALRRFYPKEPLPPEFFAMNSAFIRFSSGTTGAQKGVLLTHEGIAERTTAANRALGISARDVVAWVLPMSYHFVVSILLYLREGARIRLCLDDMQANDLTAALARGDVTFLYASPFHYYKLATTPRLCRDDLARVRLAVSTCMKLPAETGERFHQKFGIRLVEAYGIIEVGLPFIGDPSGTPGSVGRALPDYEVRLFEPDEQGIGEVWLRGKGMFRAYLSPWQTFQPGVDWFQTGDLGTLDKDGRLTIVGRLKNVINFLGMKIFPYEVEAVLNRHPAVAEARVYGEEHPRFGQIPCAEVVLKAKAKANGEEIRAFGARYLAAHEVPMEVHFVSALKKTPSGKLYRRDKEEIEP